MSLTLYADRNLTRVIGSAIYSCTFNFGQEAICDGQFHFGGGSIIALGPAKLDGSEIILAVTGGTGRYEGAHGQVTSTLLGLDEEHADLPLRARLADERRGAQQRVFVLRPFGQMVPYQPTFASFAPARFAFERSAPITVAPSRFAPERFAPIRYAPFNVPLMSTARVRFA